MRKRKIELTLNALGTARIGTQAETTFNILDFVESPEKAITGREAVDLAYHKLQRSVYEEIVLPSYREVNMPENPPSEFWARTAGATGVMIYFPAGNYLWDGVPQLWPRTGIYGDGYLNTVFIYSGNQINQKRPEQLPPWHLSSYGDPSFLVLGTCSIMGTKLLGVNAGIRDIRFIPGYGGRDNSGIILAGHLMNQQVRDCNIMQHGKGRATVGLGSVAVQGDWTPESLDGIYRDVKVHGGRTHTSHVNDLVVDNLQIEKPEAGLWLSSVKFGHVRGCRYYHSKVGEIFTSCHGVTSENFATNCDLGGYYNKALSVKLHVFENVNVGYAYKAQSRDDRDERLDLKFDVCGKAERAQRVAVGTAFEEPLGIWKPGDPVAGT